MKSPPEADRPLTPETLLLEFGGNTAVTRQSVRTLFAALHSDDGAALTRWMPWFGRWAGRAIDRLPQHLARLAGRYGVAIDPANAARLLFAMQTYYALLVNLLAERCGHGRVDRSLPGNPFSWCDSVRSKDVARLVEQLTEACAGYQITATAPAEDGECDLFKPLYQNLFPRPLRRQLGEYYTPDWLAAHVLDQVGYTGQPGQRLLDPACGSGTFLMMALRRLLRGEERGQRRGERGEGDQCLRRCGGSTSARTEAVELPRQHESAPLSSLSSLPDPLSPPFPIVGFDLNPLAVMTARANFLIGLADLLPKCERVELPIYLYDSILGQGETGEAGGETFDFVVGNPPWIAWDNLPEDDRQATKPLWERYGLFSLSGNEARHGGGKKDLSMLMLYAAADRYLKPSGRLGMVITQTLFQTKGAGDGFRRFCLGPDGPPLKVLRVDDMVALRPFDDASNWTSTIVLEKGAVTEYPVPYFKWKKGRGERGERRGGRERSRTVPSPLFSLLSPLACLARPIDPAKPTSPWLVLEAENTRHDVSPLPTEGWLGEGTNPLPADYVAHLGANSGGANGVYWVEVLGESDDGVLIRNLAARGKHRLDVVEQVIEPDLLYPLLRWGDVGRYSATPAAHLLLAQDPATRLGIDQTVMQARYPRTLAYLERFRELLISRAAYRRYQQRGPFYAMYNVGPYTVAPIKVVWRRMDRRINAAVVESCGAGVPPACWGGSCTATPGATMQLSPQRPADVPLHRRSSAECNPLPGTACEQAVAHGLEKWRPMIPQETCVLVACDSSDEAHYLCAMLNSAAVNELVAGHSVCGGKGFGTPGMFDFLPLRRYRPDDPQHVELAELSRQAHTANRCGGLQADAALLTQLQQKIDERLQPTIASVCLWERNGG